MSFPPFFFFLPFFFFFSCACLVIDEGPWEGKMLPRYVELFLHCSGTGCTPTVPSQIELTDSKSGVSPQRLSIMFYWLLLSAGL